MTTNWIPLQSIPREGNVLRIDDQAVWESPIREFAVPCRIVEAVIAEIFILPQEKGVLFRGKISGKVALPCNRCSEDCIVTINHAFDSFEPLPAAFSGKPEDKAEDFLEIDQAVVRISPNGGIVELNPAALAWEEFSLALPVKPLCGEDCKGLCPVCGCNRNNETCPCAAPEGDPRMAALHGITVGGKK